MPNRHQTESVHRLMIQTVWPFVLIIVVLLGSMVFSLEIMASLRAFVGGESIWSKAQKQAHIALEAYIHSHAETDYQDFLQAIVVPMGDHKARLALDQAEPDVNAAFQGFVEGGNRPEDIPGMIRLYRHFGKTFLLEETIRFWAEGDVHIVRLNTLGQRLYQKITVGDWNRADMLEAIGELNSINQEVAPFEDAFSTSITVVSHRIEQLIMALLLGLTTVLTTLGLYLSHRLASQRQTALQAERREADKNLAFLRNAGDGIHIVDANGNIMEVSDSFCTMLGYERDEVIGMNLAQVEALHNPDEIASAMRDLIERNTRFQVDTVHRRKDGRLLDIELSVMPMILDGQVFLFASSRDITARKQAETALAESRNLLQVVIDHVPVRIFWKDRELRYLGCNPAFARDAGKSHPGELIGQDDYQMAWSTEAELYRGDDRQVIEEDRAKLDYVEPQTTPEGSRWVRTWKVPLRTVNNEVFGILGIYEDITKTKRLNEELAQYRTHLEELVEARTRELQQAHQHIADTQYAMDKVGIGITWVDFDTGRFIYSNPCASSFLGYTPEEMCQLTVSDIDPGFPAERYRESREQIKQQGHIKFETAQQAKDGHLIPVEVVIYYHPAATGSGAQHFIVFQSDISPRKEAERTLMEAKESAVTANLAKSIFLANMSHEIRTPMNGVIGMSEMLLNTRLADEQRKMVRIIRDSAQTQLGILNDILDFSKIEAGKFSFSIEPFALPELVEKTCAGYLGDAQRKGVTLRYNVESRIPPILAGDGLRVRQILSNFLSNAFKFSSGLDHPGEVEATARLVGEENSKVWVELAVRDNGIGMDAATLERVFHPFAQADASTTRQYGGTGLGLVISMRLAEAMGGEIRVDSTPGVGSTFTARLPFSPADPAEPVITLDTPAVADVAGSLPSREEALAQGWLILVAEDNDTNQEVIQQQLTMLGYPCDIAPDGQAAFSRWLTGEYGLILTDLHMPQMDGYQLAQTIRAEEAQRGHGHIPILALTANVLKGEAERCQAAGMDGYLAKPVPLSQLKEQLVRWLPAVTDSSPLGQTAEAPAIVEATEAVGKQPVFDLGTLTRMVGNKPAIHRRLLEKFQVTAQA
ncbi:MAG TPA: PAS domain S-box protein, partial [Candidatus Competibacteraceae bacterium]|nr:PAS domain S-box protein [Candidatus Competibacteraceae bacterium]